MADQVARQPISADYARAVLAARAAPRGSMVENYATAAVVTFLMILGFAILAPGCRHWFVMPLWICGILAGADIVAWIRGQLDNFDPRAMIGILAYHGCAVSPLLHMFHGNDAFTPYFNSQIEDWGYWFGVMSGFNALGLVIFHLVQARTYRATRPLRTTWQVDDSRFLNVLLWAIAVSAVATAFIILRFGGLKRDSDFLQTGGDALVHTSWVLMLGDPLGLLIAMGVVRALSDPRRRKSIATIAIVLVALAVAQFLILGLRGSRSALLYVLFMVAGMCHYRLGKIKVRWVLLGGVLMLAFVYYYAFFKRMGAQGFQALQSTEARLALEARTGITFTGILLGDLSRAEMQTFMLHRLYNHSDRYRLRYGQTYWRSALTVIPRAIWPDKPPGKEEAGTNLQYGEGTFRLNVSKSTRVYGLAGEAMLNFGTFGIPMMFAVYGWLVGWYRRKLSSLRADDARLFIVPMFSLALILTFFADSDNLIFGLLKNGTLPTLVVVLGSVRAATALRR